VERIIAILLLLLISSCSTTHNYLVKNNPPPINETRSIASSQSDLSCIDLLKKLLNNFSDLDNYSKKFTLENMSLAEVASHLEQFQKIISTSKINRGFLDESKDIFEIPFNQLLAHLKKIKNQNQDNSVLILYVEQIEMKIKHAKLDAPGGRYPFTPSLEILSDSKRLYQNIDPSIQPNHLEKIGNPEEYAKRLDDIKTTDKIQTRKILNNPDTYYKDYSTRLKKYGPNAKFPEYEGLLSLAEIKLSSDDFLASIDENPILAKLRENVLSEIKQMKKEGFPYRKTINAMEQTMALFDIQQRAFNTKIDIPPLYHSLRWQYHANIMKGAIPEHVLLPSIYPLGITDLLKIRGQPMGFIGFETAPMYVDGHYQSSLEFWFHDFNHSRRMWQQYADRSKELSLDLESYRKISDNFVRDEVLPLVKIQKSDSDELKEIKRLAKVILFEIVHEDALPLDKAILKESLERPPLGIGRFVFETLDKDISTVSYAKGYNVSVLAITFRKLEGNFYDMSAMRISGLGGEHVRTREWVLKAANYLNENLKLGIDSDVLLKNVSDDSGLPVDLRVKIKKSSQEDPRIQPLQEPAADEHFNRTGEYPGSIPFYEK
jgi:hypothetical protein